MAQLIWSSSALRDIARLHSFLAPKNRAAADRAVGTIRRSVSALARHSEIGRPIADMPAEFREWFVPFGNAGYVVRYRYDHRLVTILAIRHSREAGY
jgi:plasmid stabilization system protein ParE